MAPAPGCNSPGYSFPAGSYRIYLKAVDPYGKPGSTSIDVTVI